MDYVLQNFQKRATEMGLIEGSEPRKNLGSLQPAHIFNSFWVQVLNGPEILKGWH